MYGVWCMLVRDGRVEYGSVQGKGGYKEVCGAKRRVVGEGWWVTSEGWRG